ncbi:MAG: hypothetical protein ABSA58_18205 [Acetobacteraceae bacterium]|jgi:hypothetical protein
MAGSFTDLMMIVQDRQRRDSLFLRRVVGGAFIIGLVLLGLALPIMV